MYLVYSNEAILLYIRMYSAVSECWERSEECHQCGYQCCDLLLHKISCPMSTFSTSSAILLVFGVLSVLRYLGYSGFMQLCNSSHTMGSRYLGYGLVLYTPTICHLVRILGNDYPGVGTVARLHKSHVHTSPTFVKGCCG